MIIFIHMTNVVSLNITWLHSIPWSLIAGRGPMTMFCSICRGPKFVVTLLLSTVTWLSHSASRFVMRDGRWSVTVSRGPSTLADSCFTKQQQIPIVNLNTILNYRAVRCVACSWDGWFSYYSFHWWNCTSSLHCLTLHKPDHRVVSYPVV